MSQQAISSQAASSRTVKIAAESSQEATTSKAMITSKPGNNETVQAATNHSVVFAGNDSFPYLIPYDVHQSCDIFGPLCQPGTITVNAVDKAGQTSAATLPCSSYLTAQASYLLGNTKGTAGDLNVESKYPQSWAPRYGRSPQCHSLLLKSQAAFDKSVKLSFSECPATMQASASAMYPLQAGAGISPYGNECCNSTCHAQIPDFRLYYFEPVETDKTYCSGNNASRSSWENNVSLNYNSRMASISADMARASASRAKESLPKRMISMRAEGSGAGPRTAVVGTHTLYVFISHTCKGGH